MVQGLKKEIGIRVKSARNARGLTQIDLADTIDKSFETISNIERGKTAPNFTTLQEIADALSVELKYFFDFADPAATALRTRLKSELDATTLEEDDRQLALINELARAVANAK